MSRRLRDGFTLLEVSIVSGLMALLAVLLSAAWAGWGRPALDAATLSCVVQEANLATASLAHDLSGYLADHAGRLGGKANLKFVGRMQPGNSQLRFCFDGGPEPNGLADWVSPDRLITYEVRSNKLIRWDESTGTTFTVARHVDKLELTNLGNSAQIKLTFKYRNLTRSYTLVARDP